MRPSWAALCKSLYSLELSGPSLRHDFKQEPLPFIFYYSLLWKQDNFIVFGEHREWGMVASRKGRVQQCVKDGEDLWIIIEPLCIFKCVFFQSPIQECPFPTKKCLTFPVVAAKQSYFCTVENTVLLFHQLQYPHLYTTGWHLRIQKRRQVHKYKLQP